MISTRQPTIIVLVGPTASGKSNLAVIIAKKFNGEVISADSRQVYKGLDIGTGKITKSEMKGIPHHLLDVISFKKQFSVADFKRLAEAEIYKIINKGKLPILCGGTGFYVNTLIDGNLLPNVTPDNELRSILERKSFEHLLRRLKKLDRERYEQVDQKNKRRIIRAIEIAKTLGKAPKITTEKKYKHLFIGLLPENLRKRIHIRLRTRLKKGMIREAQFLYKKGLTYRRMEDLGLEYKYLAKLLNGELSREEFEYQLETAICQYSKRQMTWFRSDKRIKWFEPKEDKEILKTVENFLKKQ